MDVDDDSEKPGCGGDEVPAPESFETGVRDFETGDGLLAILQAEADALGQGEVVVLQDLEECPGCNVCDDCCPGRGFGDEVTAEVEPLWDCVTCEGGVGSPPPPTMTFTRVREKTWAGELSVCGWTFRFCWGCSDNGMRLYVTYTRDPLGNEDTYLTVPYEVPRIHGSCGVWAYGGAGFDTVCGPGAGTLYFRFVGADREIPGDYPNGPGGPPGTSAPDCSEPEPIEPAPPGWWVTRTKEVVSVPAGDDPPTGWLAGPQSSEAKAKFWRDMVGEGRFCVEWQDHAGDPAAPPAIPVSPELDPAFPPEDDVRVPTPLADLPATVGPPYQYAGGECVTVSQLDPENPGSLVYGATRVRVAYPDGSVWTEFWNCPPRFPEGYDFGSYQPVDDDDNPVGDPIPYLRPAAETPPRLRKVRVIDPDGRGPWYSEPHERALIDHCPDEPYPDPAPADPATILCPGDTPRFETTGDELPWRGFEQRRSALDKCRQNCPPCSRARKCLYTDFLGNTMLVDDVRDPGSDWRPELEYVVARGDLLIRYLMVCNWVCSNPCNKSRFPILCDSSHPSYIGCANREGPEAEGFMEAVRFAAADTLRATAAPRNEPVQEGRVSPAAVVRRPAGGPGTELKKLLESLGIAPGGCGCNARAAEMDRWGADGCEARAAEIVGWLRAEYARLGWGQTIRAAARAVASGLAFHVDARDPAPGLLAEAIRLAREKESRPS